MKPLLDSSISHQTFTSTIHCHLPVVHSKITPTMVKCAPSNNLNVGFPQFPTAKELHERLVELTSAGGGGEFIVRNFVGVIQDISIEASTVETPLFPKGALEVGSERIRVLL